MLIGYLAIYYVGIYVFAGFCGYVCFSIVAGLDKLGKRIFISIVAFGLASMCGLIVSTVLIKASRMDLNWTGSFPTIVYTLIYVLSGFAGVWFALKGAKTLLLAWKRR